MIYEKIKQAIGSIVDPSYGRPLLEVNGIESLTIDPLGNVEAIILVKNIALDKNTIKREIVSLIKIQYEMPGVRLEFKQNYYQDVKAIQYIGVVSGKGGVGKSTVTINLAKALKKQGYRVGIIDADVYGASIPTILGMGNIKLAEAENEMIYPAKYCGIEIISTAFFVEKEKPLMWRAPMLTQLLNHFFTGIKWHDEVSHIIIDLPPGTGDVLIDLKSFVPNAKMIVVTTPDMDAATIAVKAGFGSLQTGHQLIGVIENMSYYENPVTKTPEFIFGEGGGEHLSQTLDVRFLGQVPITKSSKILSDIYHEIVNKIFQ